MGWCEPMILKELWLRNIRSYTEERVSFPQGTILLSGDIGSGKSTILLAIEFALFGASRPDLPAEMLLRKGTNLGEVELRFSLHDAISVQDAIPTQDATSVQDNSVQDAIPTQDATSVQDGGSVEHNPADIIIHRTIKREKVGIKQLPGYIIRNQQKKELMPVELKAEMVSLLGYPEDVIGKNKNYIFRYTVYTPQEEMKLILLDDAEARLDVLRKIFNVDKYKVIRENLQLYLRQLRTDMAVLQAKVQPLEELKVRAEGLQEELRVLGEQEEHLRPQIEDILQQREHLNKQVGQWEQKQQEYRELQLTLQLQRSLLGEKEKQLASSQQSLEQVHLQLTRLMLPEGATLEEVTNSVKEVDSALSKTIQERTGTQARLVHLQKVKEEVEGELHAAALQLQAIPDKEQLLGLLGKEVANKETWKQKQQQLQELFERTAGLITKNETILSQSRSLMERIATLVQCPTCCQDVTSTHKEVIRAQEEQKIKQADNLLFELKKKRSQIYQQREEAVTMLEGIILKERQLVKVRMELGMLQDKKELVAQRQEQFSRIQEEHQQVREQLRQWQDDSVLEALQQEKQRQQELANMLIRRELLEKQKEELEQRRQQLLDERGKLEGTISSLQSELLTREDLSLELLQKKGQLLALEEQEKTLLQERAKMQAQKVGVEKQQAEMHRSLQEMLREKSQLIRRQEQHHWLDEFFLNLTYTIEKQVMISIHQLFSQLFQEWFSLLIDNEQMTARLDDGFTPVIEQNGYDMSFENLSGGERTSAALAYRLALNKVINDVIHAIRTKDLLILDEPTDGFSSEQLDKVREVLERLAIKQIVLVSHEAKMESMVERVLRVGKEGHVSRVISC